MDFSEIIKDLLELNMICSVEYDETDNTLYRDIAEHLDAIIDAFNAIKDGQ